MQYVVPDLDYHIPYSPNDKESSLSWATYEHGIDRRMTIISISPDKQVLFRNSFQLIFRYCQNYLQRIPSRARVNRVMKKQYFRVIKMFRVVASGC